MNLVFNVCVPDGRTLPALAAVQYSCTVSGVATGKETHPELTVHGVRHGGNMEVLDRVMCSMTITMYGADWCGDCRRAKTWFEANDIDYVYVDLVESPGETERVLERNNGLKKIPVIVFPDDSHLVEPSNDELAAKMAELAAVAGGAGSSAQIADGQATDADEPAEPVAPAVVENSHLGRFELLRYGDVVSFATYTGADGNVVVPHVETEPAHRGNGYAAELMEGLLTILRDTGRTITPRCPFAAQHIRDNEQHHDLVAGT